jgi:hypothetical protein
MSGSGARVIGACLPPALIKQLEAYLDQSSRLSILWRQCVQPPLADHAHPANYVHGRLEIECHGSAWASRLRHNQNELLRQLRQLPGFEDLRELRVRVVPLQRVASAPAAAARIGSASRMPATAAAMMQSLADSVADPTLRAALQRLGKDAAASKP